MYRVAFFLFPGPSPLHLRQLKTRKRENKNSKPPSHPPHNVRKRVEVADVVDGGLAREEPRQGQRARAAVQGFGPAAHAAGVSHVEHTGVGVEDPTDGVPPRSPLRQEQDSALVLDQVGKVGTRVVW